MMFNAFGIIFGILLVALLITLLDWFGRRKDRRRNHLA
jgi:type II secretory pathway pseudopilin PulG